MYVNLFSGLDHEDLYTYLTKFYEIYGTLGASKTKEDVMFMRLFLNSLISKAKDWYLDQPMQIITNWNILE